MKVSFLVIFFISLIQVAEAKSLLVMSYNVENLFDVSHDVVNGKEKKDWSFLPKDAPGKKEACLGEKSKHYRKECLDSDWTAAKLELKAEIIVHKK